MKEKLISLKIAKLAKEKGFTVKDNYSEDFKYYHNVENNYLKYPLPFEYLRVGYGDDIPAPTQSLLQKWLREEFNIQMVIKPYWDSLLNKCMFSCDVIRIKDGKVIKSLKKDSYEEALDQGLVNGMSLINRK